MDTTVNSYRPPDGEMHKISDVKDREVRQAQRAVVGLLGRLSELTMSIGQETRERYEHALALREFSETMYLAFGNDLNSDIQDIRYDKIDDYGPYVKSNLLGDDRLRQSVEFLAEGNTEARALLQKLDMQPSSFDIKDGIELVNRLLGTELKSDYYRNAAGRGLEIAFDQSSDIISERKTAMIAAMREVRQTLQVLQEIVQGQEETLR